MKPKGSWRRVAWGVGAITALAAAGAQFAPGVVSGAGVTLRRLIPQERLRRPVHLAEVPDGSRRLVIVEQEGVIKWFDPEGERAGGVVLDIRDRMGRLGNEEGLLSVAFHPDFDRTRAFFVFYSAAGPPRRSVVSRFDLAPSGLTAPPGSEQVLLEVPQPYANHNGGQVAFGPDGYLYIGLGDGGAGGDPHGNGQNLNTLLSAILRIDVNEPGSPYGIPPDNPFAGAGARGRPEIWAYGLRNPWRFSFDRRTGFLYAGDVGQDRFEEVDRIRRGVNYGWNIMEGRQCFRPSVGCKKGGLELPLAEYGRKLGVSITGGFVYRGRALPALAGRYLFGDAGSGTLWTIPVGQAGPLVPEELLQTSLFISSFGEDARGELYVLDLRGAVFRIVPEP